MASNIGSQGQEFSTLDRITMTELIIKREWEVAVDTANKCTIVAWTPTINMAFDTTYTHASD